MAGNQGNDIVLMGKEKLTKKIQKAEYKISKHQKRFTSGVSTWVKHVILCLAFQVGFTWTLTGNRVWRCSDYFLFLGCYLVLCAFGWLQLFLTGRYYIQSVMKCDRRWRERRDLEGRLAVLKGSSRVQGFDDGHQCHIVLGIMAPLCVASCMLAMFILFLEAFSGNLADVCRGN
ncbi:hypothetical protein C1H46_030650 [Malus baccata]|uniref:Uncharacterized protein n=1 Tax=Malus baccata TaxID=106549 RepID=A0A540LBM7_MALBA|nr:hypothetical protein C1H46_030650 [Malus baccata]